MTFYQELQLSSTGSKNLIKTTTDPKERRRHILIYNFKVYLVMAFCFVFVTLFSKTVWPVSLFFWRFSCFARQTLASVPHMDCYALPEFL